MRKVEAGFSLVELMIVCAVGMISIGLAAPSITNAIQIHRFNSDVQRVSSLIRDARATAVATNRAMRVLFNCPSAGQMRVVEVIDTADDAYDALVNGAADRCDLAAYPYPAADIDSTTAPNNDGPVVSMGQYTRFPSDISSIQIDTQGRMAPVTGCPASCVAGAPPFTVWVADDHYENRRSMSVATNGVVSVAEYTSVEEEIVEEPAP